MGHASKKCHHVFFYFDDWTAIYVRRKNDAYPLKNIVKFQLNYRISLTFEHLF